MAVGCADLPLRPPPDIAAVLALTPADTAYWIGQRRTFEVTVLDADDEPLDDVPVTWSSSDTRVATMEEGVAVARGPGRATIRAEAGPAHATMSLVVRPVVEWIGIEPDTIRVDTEGVSVQLHALATDSGGTPVSGTVAWSSSDEAVAVVDSLGVLTSRRGGTAVVTASRDGVVGSADVVVDIPALLRVRIVTEGNGVDPDGYLLEVAGRQLRVEPDVDMVVGDLPIGEIGVRLRDVAPHCTLLPHDGRLVTRPQPDTVSISFRAACFGDLVFLTGDAYQGLQLHHMDAFGAITELTPDDRELFFGALSPEGRRLVYVADGELWRARVDGSERVRLPVGPEPVQDVDWSAAGPRLAFVQDGAIVSSAVDGTDRRVVYAPGGSVPRHPRWSPDGGALVFDRFDSRTGRTQLFRIGADGTGLVKLTGGRGNAHRPRWSPDGTHLLYESEPEPGRSPRDIRVVRADGSGDRLVSVGEEYATDASWSPDGRDLVFNSSGWKVYRVTREGTDPMRLTRHGLYPTVPVWMPSGTHVMGGASSGLTWMRADGTEGGYLRVVPKQTWGVWPLPVPSSPRSGGGSSPPRP